MNGERVSGVGRAFVIYYGWLSSSAQGGPNAVAERIIHARAPLVIVHTHTAAPGARVNLTPPVRRAFEAAGSEVYGYVPCGFGRRDPADVEGDIDAVLHAGAHGIFLDEVDPQLTDVRLGSFQRIARYVRARGASAIANPGVARCSQIWLDLADRLMVEHQWRRFARDCVWARGADPERLMAVSSDEERAMGYAMTEDQALADTREAGSLGFGWHCSTGHYTALPEWFDRYHGAVRAHRTS